MKFAFLRLDTKEIGWSKLGFVCLVLAISALEACTHSADRSKTNETNETNKDQSCPVSSEIASPQISALEDQIAELKDSAKASEIEVNESNESDQIAMALYEVCPSMSPRALRDREEELQRQLGELQRRMAEAENRRQEEANSRKGGLCGQKIWDDRPQREMDEFESKCSASGGSVEIWGRRSPSPVVLQCEC